MAGKSTEFTLGYYWVLRADDCNFEESRDKTKKSNFFLQDQKDPFSELFSKILFKSSSEFYFLRNRGKFEIVAHGL